MSVALKCSSFRSQSFFRLGWRISTCTFVFKYFQIFTTNVSLCTLPAVHPCDLFLESQPWSRSVLSSLFNQWLKWTKGQLCPPLPIMLWLSWSYSASWCHSHWLLVAVVLVLCGAVWAAGITFFSLELWVETRLNPGQGGLRQSGCQAVQIAVNTSKGQRCLWFSSSSFHWNTMLCKLNLGVGHIFLFYFPPFLIISMLCLFSFLTRCLLSLKIFRVVRSTVSPLSVFWLFHRRDLTCLSFQRQKTLLR